MAVTDYSTPLTLLVSLGILMVCQGFHYDGFFDPYNIDNTFHMDCGNVTSRRMHMMFRGDAFLVYYAYNSSCVAEEVEPGHFQILDAFLDPPCTPHKTPHLDLYSMEIVIQTGLVSQFDDPHHVVTCNYELGAMEVSAGELVDDSPIERVPDIIQVNTAKAQANFTIGMEDVRGREITKIMIGSYMHLVISMTVIPGSEETFRPWNCRSFATDKNGILHEHYILLEGCGDGDVIKRDRGFNSTTDNVTAIAKSVYFRAFGLGDALYLKFECDFVIKNNHEGLGPSCFMSPAAKSAVEAEKANVDRKKRALPPGPQKIDRNNMGYSVSRKFWLIPRRSHNYSPITYSLNTDSSPDFEFGVEEPISPQVRKNFDLKAKNGFQNIKNKNNFPLPGIYNSPYPTNPIAARNGMMLQMDPLAFMPRSSMERQPDIASLALLTSPSFFIGLVTFLSAIAIMLLIITIALVFFCYRSVSKHKNGSMKYVLASNPPDYI